MHKLIHKYITYTIILKIYAHLDEKLKGKMARDNEKKKPPKIDFRISSLKPKIYKYVYTYKDYNIIFVKIQTPPHIWCS